jgi:uncharacterized protein (DUF305 family)
MEALNPMNKTHIRIWRTGAAILLVVLELLQVGVGRTFAQEAATPTAGYSCDATQAGATPAMDHDAMPGMAAGTPMASMAIEFDQHYIDMMIPHHASIVALAQAAIPKLTDPRLQEMAQTIITAQTAEQEELRAYREEWYGSSESMAMDMGAMMDMMMPGMEMSADQMETQMDPAAQVAAFCAAADPDLAFIDLVIPHHETAIVASEAALEHANHAEIKAFAARVIEDQQREIDELSAIRLELAGSATPEA